MIRTNRSRSSARSRTAVALLAAAVGAIGLLAVPGSASAATQCRGRLKFDKEVSPVTGQAYFFYCNAWVNAYSIASNKPIDYFGPEVEAGESLFFCEGPIPGRGFGCFPPSKSSQPAGAPAYSLTAAPPGSVLFGAIGLPRNPCKRYPDGTRQRLYLTVTTLEVDSGGKTVLKSSEPFRLGPPQCKKKSQRHGAS